MIEVERITNKDANYFFGYFDLSPEDESGKYVLVNKCDFIDRMPSQNDYIDVGYVELEKKEFVKIGETSAWNFQEGCRLQWLDERKIIYNIRTNEGFGAAIYDIIEKRESERLNYPIYSINHRGYALTYDFVHNKYHYAYGGEKIIDKKNEGVFLVDLKNKKKTLLISLAEIENFLGESYDKAWVEYCVFNKSGDKFFFYYRFKDENEQIWTRFFVSDLGGNIKLLHDTGVFSHAGWKNDTQITAWARNKSQLGEIRRKKFISPAVFNKILAIYHKVVKSNRVRAKIANDSYILIDIESGDVKKFGTSLFESDGHCSWSIDSKFMLTDTYPNENDKMKLLLFDSTLDKLVDLGEYLAIPDGFNQDWYKSGMRCDLHPKWGQTNNFIYFDSVHEGLRQLYRISVRDLIEKQ